LIVELTHRHACARLVPVALVAPVARGDWGLLLTCTQAELDAQPPAVEAERHHLSGSASVTIPIADVATIEPDFVRLALGRDAVS
jgi:hypothetical protein